MRDDEWDRYEDAWFDDEDDLDVEESEDAHFFDSWKDDDSDFDLGFTKSSRDDRPDSDYEPFLYSSGGNLTHEGKPQNTSSGKNSSLHGGGLVFLIVFFGGILFIGNFRPDWLMEFFFRTDILGVVIYTIVGIAVVIFLAFAACLGWAKMMEE